MAKLKTLKHNYDIHTVGAVEKQGVSINRVGSNIQE